MSAPFPLPPPIREPIRAPEAAPAVAPTNVPVARGPLAHPAHITTSPIIAAARRILIPHLPAASARGGFRRRSVRFTLAAAFALPWTASRSRIARSSKPRRSCAASGTVTGAALTCGHGRACGLGGVPHRGRRGARPPRSNRSESMSLAHGQACRGLRPTGLGSIAVRHVARGLRLHSHQVGTEKEPSCSQILATILPNGCRPSRVPRAGLAGPTGASGRRLKRSLSACRWSRVRIHPRHLGRSGVCRCGQRTEAPSPRGAGIGGNLLLQDRRAAQSAKIGGNALSRHLPVTGRSPSTRTSRGSRRCCSSDCPRAPAGTTPVGPAASSGAASNRPS